MLQHINILLIAFSFAIANNLFAQSFTSWKGTVSTNWRTASNWTNGVPGNSVDAIIGDSNFTGTNQPVLTSNASCRNMILGNGSKSSQLTLSRNLTIQGNLLIGSNGTLLANSNRTLTLKGNWTNNGTYTASSNSARVTFSGGVTQTITGATTYRNVTVNSGSTLLLASGITVNGTLTVNGTINPTSAYTISGTGSMTVNSTGTILVYTALFNGNYGMSGSVSLNRTSTVNYASPSVNQTVSSAFTYGTLRISGGSTKSLSANLPNLSSSNSSSGRIYLDAGTFDLGPYTANRNASGGGSIVLAAGTTLRIGGTRTFPANYLTHSIASSSTVEYYGLNQTVTATSYGNLTLKSSAGTVVKTMPSNAMTVAGIFTMDAGSGTGVSAVAGNNITFNREVIIGTGCVFSGASYSHNLKGNLLNYGTFTGSSSTLTMSGISSRISGNGLFNFYNINFTAYGITADYASQINVSGNLATTTPGLFTHDSGGTVQLSGTLKTLSGNGFTFHHLVNSGSITSTANFRVRGDFTSNGPFIATSGTLTLSGKSHTISGSSSPSFYTLSVEGNISTGINAAIAGNLLVSPAGSLTATAGTVTFGGNGTLFGTASLHHVSIGSGKTLALGSGSVLGIGGNFTVSGSLNVSSFTPNTVRYDASVAQTITGTTYHHLVLNGSGTKTAGGSMTANGSISIGTGVTFDASTYDISLYRNWNNSGTFTAATSNVRFLGSGASVLIGSTVFNIFTLNKTARQVKLTLLDNISANQAVISQGTVLTGSKALSVTGKRTGNGLIIGTIHRIHSFSDGVDYAFEGPDNLITFDNPSGIDTVSVTVTIGEINDFDPAVESVNREYQISIPNGSYNSADFRYHYENNELNAFVEPFLAVYRYKTGVNWDSLSYSSRDTFNNWVQLDGITQIQGRFAASGIRNIVRWDGSASDDWNDPANWTTISGSNLNNRVPQSTDAAQIGYGTIFSQPVIRDTVSVSVLRFGSDTSVNLKIQGGKLMSSGSIRGQWSAARSHVFEVETGEVVAGTNLLLSDGTSGNDIHLMTDSGKITVLNDLTQNADAKITFSGPGELILFGNFSHQSGNFIPGEGKVTYKGDHTQEVANVLYNHLLILKSSSAATIASTVRVLGNLTISSGGELVADDSILISGDLYIDTGATLESAGSVISIGGNLDAAGTFLAGNGQLIFNGNSSQTLLLTDRLNDLIISKSAGNLTLLSSVHMNGDLRILSGVLDMDTFTANRTFEGGTLEISSNGVLKTAGDDHFPAGFSTYTLHATSTVVFEGTGAQAVPGRTYGHITFANGGGTSKYFTGNIRINGDLLIDSTASVEPDIYSVSLYGDFINYGTLVPGESTFTLKGVNKTITGNTSFNNLSVVAGVYQVSSGTISIQGNLFVETDGSLDFGSNDALLDGDLTNKGTLISNGTATFTGTRVQTFQLINAIASSSTGVINFNGTVAPVINSNSSPAFATVNINNTAGITPSVPWHVFVSFHVASGSAFHGGPLTHYFYGDFSNEGTVTSEGRLKFMPGAPYSASAEITLDGASFISTGKVEFSGTAPITLYQNAPVFSELIISNTHSSGVTAPDNWYITDELRIQPGATLHSGNANTHTITGNLVNDGTVRGQSSTYYFNGSSSEISGSGNTEFYNLTLDSSADVTLSQTVQILRDLEVNGNLNATNGKVAFTGTSSSDINGSVAEVVFGDLELNKSGAVTTLSVPVTVTGDLILSNGILHTSAVNILNIADDGGADSGSDLSHVNGPMRKTGDDAFVFPVGKNGKWARLGISAPQQATDAFTVEYFDSGYSNTNSMAGSPSPVLNNVSLNQYWICDRTAGSSSAQITLYWEDHLSGVNNYSPDLVVARWNGTGWENRGQSAIRGTTPGSVTSDSISNFSPFTFGSLSPSLNPLPVHLLSFNATLSADGTCRVEWKTAGEENSDWFVIEKSSDGYAFSECGRIKGAGTDAGVNEYMYPDPAPFKGYTYYRLKMTDLDGSVTYSSIAIIYSDISHQVEFFPNPVLDFLTVNNPSEFPVNLTLMHANGGPEWKAESVRETYVFDMRDLPSGLYLLISESNGRRTVSKILLQR